MPSDSYTDDLFDSLSSARRRAVITALDDARTPVSLSELAESITTDETESVGERSPDSVRSVTTSLHHVHLPKLDAADVVEYDVEAGEVAVGDHHGDARELLERVE
jgi:hypothetical protein